MYLVGEGVPIQPDLARTLLERAANAGNLAGSLSLGHMFETGIGVEPDLGAAEHWYRKGADAAYPFGLVLFTLEADQQGEPERQHEAEELGRQVGDEGVHLPSLPLKALKR